MKNLKAFVATVLVITLVTGIIPCELIGSVFSSKSACASDFPMQADSEKEDILDMADGTSAEEQILSSDSWTYILTDDTDWAVITGYKGPITADIKVPDQLDGYDVVGIASSVSASLTGISSIEIPGNVLSIGTDAFPKGITVRSVHAAYAQTWARKNSYAHQCTSEFDFCDGVIDLSDIRAENFVRVSAEEVWLRELEAKRLSVGSLFFLPDPGDLYQISYYQVVSVSEPSGGYVTVLCKTPDVDNVLNYYEATNQPMMLDMSSIVLYDGAVVTPSSTDRSLSGSLKGKTKKIGLSWKKDFSIKDYELGFSVDYASSFSGSYKVGVFVENQTELVQTDEFTVSISLSRKYGNDKALKDDMKDWLKNIDKDAITFKSPIDKKENYEQRLMFGTVFSLYGIVTITVTCNFSCEYSGSISITYSSKTVTTTKTKEGEDTTAVSRVVSKSCTGAAKVELKVGVSASLEIYLLGFRVAAVGFFFGLKIPAKLELSNTFDTVKDSAAYGDINQFDILKQMLGEKQSITVPEDVNINMFDCVTIAINFIVEFEIKAGLGKSVTLYSKKIPLLDLNIITFHLHLCTKAYDPEPFTDDWDLKDSYEYTLSDDKDNWHIDVKCPYDFKTVKVVLPYDNNRIVYYNRRVPSGSYQYEPVLKTADCSDLGYKFVAYHTDESLDADSIVTEWPQKIYEDTTYYVEAAKMHKITLIGSNRETIAGDTTKIQETFGSLNYITLSDRNNFVASGEFLILPAEKADGTAIDHWILVNSKSDLTPVGFDPNSENWKIPVQFMWPIREDMPDSMILCAVTEKDVALYFHTGIQGETYMRYAKRGSNVALPSCDVTVSRFAFSGWTDQNGDPVTGPIAIDVNSDSVLHYYADWEPSNTVTAVSLDNPHIGSTDPGYGGNIPEDPKTAFSYTVKDRYATITGYSGTETYLRIPSTIEIDDTTSYTVTGIAGSAFQNTSLVSVILPGTVNTIGTGAFSGCPNLELIDLSTASVSAIPDRFAYGDSNLRCVRLSGDVTDIGSSAFYGCKQIDSLYLNANIASYAFQNCTGVTSIKLGAGVTKIGAYAFFGCYDFTELEVPDSVTELGNSFIRGCSGLKTLIMKPGVEKLTAEQMTIGSGSSLEELTLDGCVTTLGDSVFANDSYGFIHLTDLTVKTILKKIGSNILKGSGIETLKISLPGSTQNAAVYSTGAFYGMTTLKTLYVESGRIAESMFSGNTSLQTVKIGSAVSAIEKEAFKGCTALTTVDFGEQNSDKQDTGEQKTGVKSSVSSIGDYAFQNCTALTLFSVPSSATVLGRGILYGCRNLKTLEINGFEGMVLENGNLQGEIFAIGQNTSLDTLKLGKGIVAIGDNVFSNEGYGFKDLTLNLEEGTLLQSIGSNAFAGTSIKELVCTGDMSIGSSAFLASKIEKLEIQGEATIGNAAFSNCTSLTTVHIGRGTIGNEAFKGCTNLTDVKLSSRVTVSTPRGNNAERKDVILEMGVTSIGAEAFRNCTSLTKLIIPDSVTQLNGGMIQGCTKLETLEIGCGIPEMTLEYNASFTGNSGMNGRNPFYIGSGSTLKNIILHEGITQIGPRVFGNCPYNQNSPIGYPELKYVYLPNSLQSIGEDAFYGAPLTDVKDITLSYPTTAFAGKTSVEKVTVTGGTVAESAFVGCTGLITVSLNEGVTGIGRDAFKNCTELTSLKIPDSVTQLDGGMIQGCTKLETLEIGCGIPEMTLEYNASFTGSSAMDGRNPFYIGSGSILKRIILHEGITQIGSKVFGNCSYYTHTPIGHPELKYINLPNSLQSIGEDAFYGAPLTDMKDITLSFPTTAFAGKTSVEKVTVTGGTVAESAFVGCTGLITVNLNEGVTGIGRDAFKNCTELTSLKIPDSVTQLDGGMIQGCTKLETLEIGCGIPEMTLEYNASFTGSGGMNGRNPFYIGSGSTLKRIILHEGITQIGSKVFGNCPYKQNTPIGHPELTYVNLPNSLQSIGEDAFYGAPLTDVKDITLSYPTTAFAGKTSVEKVTVTGGTVAQSAFVGCTALKTVDLKEGVTSIGPEAFKDCTELASLKIPNSVTQLGANMIKGCTSLETLNIGCGIPELALKSNSHFTSINASNTNPFYIGSGSSLHYIILQEGITRLGPEIIANGQYYHSSHSGYSELTHVDFPKSLKSIETDAFYGAPIATVKLPDGITSISDSAFSNFLQVIYSLAYSSVIDAYASGRNIPYVFGDKSNYPRYQLTRVVPSRGSGERAIQYEEGSLHITRGTEGETAELSEDFIILSSEEVIYTDAVITEDPPVAAGYAFYGWFTDPEFKHPWTMLLMPAADITLYARVEPLLHIRYAVNLDTVGTADETLPAGFALYREERIREYEAIPIVPDPFIDGYAFVGWYMDTAFTLDFITSTADTGDITIFGRMHKVSAGATYRLVDGTYALSGYHREEDEGDTVYIPAWYNGLPVTAVNADAFSGGGIREVYLPDSIEQVDVHAFDYSDVRMISVSKANTVYSTQNGVLYSKDKTKLLRYPPKKTSITFTVPASVTGIGAYAFNGNTRLASIVFPEDLAEIGTYAFNGCTGLTSITLPDSVSVLRDGAFSGCSNLVSFTAYGLTVIEGYKNSVSYEEEGHTAIEGGDNDTIPRNQNMMVYGPIGTGVLRNWFSFKINGVSYTANYNHYSVNLYVDGKLQRTVAGEAGMPLSTILLDSDENDNMIADWYRDDGFQEIWNIETDLMPATTLNLYTSLIPVYTCEEITVTINGQEISGIALTGYNGKASGLTIPKMFQNHPVIAIADSFLSGSCTVTSLTIGDHVLSINENAMSAFTGVIICDAGSPAESWAAERGLQVREREYTVTYSIEYVNIAATKGARGTAFFLPTPQLGSYTFGGWFTDSECTVPAVVDDNGMYVIDGNDIILYGLWNNIETVDFVYEIVGGSIIITGYTGNARDIVIPQTIASLPVTAIGDDAFMGGEMRSIDLGSITELGDNAFANCDYLVSVAIPDSVTSIGTATFADCDLLKSCILGAGVSSMDPTWFDGCGLFKNVTVSDASNTFSSIDGVVYSKDGNVLVFYPCGRTAETFVTPNGVTAIGQNAFQSQDYMKQIVLPDTVTAVRDYAFCGCSNLMSVSAPGLTDIGSHAFFGCSSLITADFGAALNHIGRFAFVGCSSLSSIYIPESMVLNQDEVYFDSSSLTITGTYGSSAYEYASKHGIAFYDPDATNVTSVSLDQDSLTLLRGEITQLRAIVDPADALIGQELTWYSEDEKIAYVDQNGTVCALGGGSTRISVFTSNGLSASCDVNVEVHVTCIMITPDELHVTIGSVYQLEPVILPASATDKSIIWTSSDESVATVESGLIVAISEGTAVISAQTHNGLTATVTVLVFIPVESIVITGTSGKLWPIEPMNSLQLTASILPDNATDKTLTWTSSDPAVASVDQSGKVTALAEGNVEITVTANDPMQVFATYMILVGSDTLSKMTLPASLLTIEEEAFFGIDSVQFVKLGEHTTTIGSKAFAEMNGLLVISIPESVSELANNAFDGSTPVLLCKPDSYAVQYAIINGMPYILVEDR